MIKIIAAMLLILLPDAFAFAGAGQTFDWDSLSCQDQRARRIMNIMAIDQQSYAVAQERTESAFKICLCARGDEAKIAIDTLVDSHEIELIIPDPVRTITTSIEYGRDFNIQFNNGNNRCYLHVSKPELCNNAGFMNDAKSYFDVPSHYDAKLDLCVVELDHNVFKAKD